VLNYKMGVIASRISLHFQFLAFTIPCVFSAPTNSSPISQPFPSYRGILVKLSLLTRISLFNALVRNEPLNSGLHNLVSKK